MTFNDTLPGKKAEVLIRGTVNKLPSNNQCTILCYMHVDAFDKEVYYITINRKYFRQCFQPIAYFVIFYDLGFFPLNICY